MEVDGRQADAKWWGGDFFRKRLLVEEGRSFENERSNDEVGRWVGGDEDGSGILTRGFV